MRFWEQMKTRGCALLALVLLLTSLVPAALAATYPFGGVINDDTNLRRAPKSNEANVIRRVAEGQAVEVIGAEGNFYHIRVDGQTGYVFKQYVDRSTGSTGGTGSTGSTGSTGGSAVLYTTVTTADVRLRETASTSGRKLLTIPDGATVTVHAVSGSWVNVTYGGKTGWCYKDYVRLLDNPAPTANVSAGVVNSTYLTLQSGADSDHVIALQEALIELGFLRATADGVYGSATAQAVMAFQRENDLPLTGVADPNLQALLYMGKPVDYRGNKVEIKTLSALSGQNIRYGDRGLLVRTVQSRLEILGYLKDNVTGTYDTATQNAVKEFQRKNGLKVDGVAGEDTQRLLASGGLGSSATPTEKPTPTPTPLPTFQVPTATVRNGSKGENARLVQERLIQLGYMSGTADGKFGSQSVAALKAFQRKNSLTADGVAGSGTYEVLFSHLALAADYVPVATPTPTPPPAPEISTTYPPVTEDNVTVVKKGVTGDAVKRLQTRLTELGYYNARKDGICRDDDVAAIRAFQRKNGLDVDGVAGYATQSILFTNLAIMDNGEMAGSVMTYTLLKKGMEGQDVLAMQQRLAQLGYLTAGADGIYGTDTAEAVYNFQKKNGLVRDGIAGEKTLRAMYSVNAVKADAATQPTTPPATIVDALVKQGDTGSLVTALQERLIKLGYLSGTADGIFGEKTYRAVYNFQKANALTADGIAGSKTFAALNITGVGNNGSAGNVGGSTAPTVTDSPSAGTGMGSTVAVTAKNVVYEYWYSTVRNACRKYPYATVYDYQTGISWQVHMFSYGKHAEAEPLTAADTAAMEKACGGNKWTPRPVWVIFADGTIRMATTHSVPHEVEHIRDNDFPGHTCIHFPRTMAQVTAIGPYATRHQQAVEKAWIETQAMAAGK